MEPYDDEDGWTWVRYRRGRLQHDRHRQPRHEGDSSRGRQQRPERRTYASVTRDNQRHHRHYPARSERPQQRRPGADAVGDRRQQRFQGSRLPPPRRRRYSNPDHRGQNIRFDPKQRQRQPARDTNTHRDNQNWVQSDDPHFTYKVRIIYRIIKSQHHLNNVSGAHPPPMIQKTTTNLINFIKPASPNDDTQMLLEGNAKNWEHNTILILRQHYEENMNEDIQNLEEFETQEWEGPFQVASAWANRNLGRRLKAETLNDVKAFLKANLTEHLPPETGDDRAPTPTCAAPPAAVTEPAATAAVSTPSAATRREVTARATIHTTTATMTEQRGGDGSPFLADPEKEQFPPPPPPVPLSPLPPRPPRPFYPLFTSLGSQVQTSEANPQPASPPQPPHNPCMRFDEENQSTSADDAQPPDETENLLQLFDLQQTPYGLTRHANTTRKVQDWSLCVKKKHLIIGDSNLGRFPPFQVQDLQVDSYPGATFHHAEAILKKTICTVTVETVLLAFGLENRKQKTQATAIRQLQAAVRMAHSRFPLACVLVPMVNFSPDLPAEDRKNLQTLNDHIMRNFDSVPRLPDQEFDTEPDNIHWTRPTAIKIFKHWLRQFN